jgi:hypothetical protein
MDAEISEGKGIQNLLLQGIRGIFYVSFASLNIRHIQIYCIHMHTHTHTHTQTVDPNSVYILRRIQTSCTLNTISTKLPT